VKKTSDNKKVVSISLDVEEMESKINDMTEKVSRLKSILVEVRELIHSLSMD
jgi:hypothetical protein